MANSNAAQSRIDHRDRQTVELAHEGGDEPVAGLL